MKKELLLCCFLFVSVFAVSGQEIHVGIKGGLNYTNINEFRFRYSSNNLRTESPGYRYGIHAGLYAEIVLPFIISIQPEFNYSGKGFRFESGGAEVDARLNYFEVPLLFKYRPVPMVNIFIGPQVSFLNNTQYAYSGAHRDYNLKADGIDFSGLAGAGITLGRLDISARYGLGFSSVFKDDGLGSDRERFAQLSVGLRLFSINERKTTDQ